METGLGMKVGDITVAFNDMSPEAWERVGKVCQACVIEVHDDGTEVRGSWLHAYENPFRFIGATRAIHVEAVRVLEPECPDPEARSKELAGTLAALRDAVCAVGDNLPVMEDGSPLDETPEA